MSCSENYKKESYEFKNEISLKRKEIKVPPVLFIVGGMVLTDNFLVTVDIKADTLFRVFKLPDYKYIGGFTSRGNGPDEENFISGYMHHLSGDKFLYGSITSIKTANIDLAKNKIEVIDKISLPVKLLNLNQAFRIGNKYYGISLNRKSTREFVSYNPQTNEISNFGCTYPKVGKKIKSPIRNMILVSTVAVKPDNSHFACVYDKFPILRIYKKDGVLETEMRYLNNQKFPQAFIEKEPLKKQFDDVMQNYRRIKVTNRFIYALYIGKTMGELPSRQSGLVDFSNEIHVWDWNGKPIKKIFLDKNIFSFCVSPDDKFLICSSLNEIDKFYKYSLNEN